MQRYPQPLLPFADPHDSNKGPYQPVRALLTYLLQMRLQEVRNLRVAIQLVRKLHDTVAFVAVAKIFHADTPAFQILHNLLRFADRNPGIVGAVDDHQRRGDLMGHVDGRNLSQHIPVIGQGAVLSLSMGTAVRRRILQESFQIGHTHHVNGRRPERRRCTRKR